MSARPPPDTQNVNGPRGDGLAGAGGILSRGRMGNTDARLTAAAEPAPRGGRGPLVAGLVGAALAAFLTIKPGGQAVAAWVGTAVNVVGPLLGLGWWLRSWRRGAGRGATTVGAPRSGSPCATSSLLLGLSVAAFAAG